MFSHFLYFDWFDYFRKALTIFRNKQINRNMKSEKHKQFAYFFSLLLCRLIRLSLHFCISEFPRFRKSETQKCGNTTCKNRQIARNLKSEKTSAMYLCFLTFHISVDLVIFKNRLRFSRIKKSVELWKAKMISNLLMFFHFYYVDWFGYLCISVFLHFRPSESGKCRNAEMQNAKIDKSVEISKVKKHKQIAYVFLLFIFRLIWLFPKIAYGFQE